MIISKQTGKRALAVLACAGLALGSLYAQDESSDSTSDFGDFFDSADSGAASSGASSNLEINGSAELSVRAILGGDAWEGLGDDSDVSDFAETQPTARVNLKYTGASTDFVANFRVDPDRVSDNPEDLIDEAYMRAYLSDFVFEAGKMKVVWGKGDNLHVVDLFNANDYTDFIFPEYIDRRIAEPMFRGIWNAPSGNLRAEAIWTPLMTADRVPTSGNWVTGQAKDLAELAESNAMYRYIQAYADYYAKTGSEQMAAAAATAVLSEYSDSSAFLPNTASLDYGQYGFRVTGTIGFVDLGASYYLGHYKTPSASVTYTSNLVSDLDLEYDRLQSFGLEAAAAIGSFNLRAEAAYYLTDDIEGDDPSVHNNSLNWLAGFDVGLPVHNVTLNIQNIGSYILGGDDIDSTADVDYDEDDIRSNNKIVVKISDSFNHEKVLPAVKGIWGIEREDLVVMPEIACTIRDDFVVTFSGALFLGSDDGEFGEFVDNDFVRVVAAYKF